MESDQMRSMAGSDAWAFAMRRQDFTSYRHYIKERSLSGLQKFLDEKFLADVEAVKDLAGAQQLVMKYGTYVLLGGAWGGRFDYTFAAKKKMSAYAGSNSLSIAAGLKASAWGFEMNANVDYSGASEFSNNFETEGTKVFVSACGGGAYGAAIASGEYANWAAHVSEKPAWCDFYVSSTYQAPGIVPIIHLIADPNKQELVKQGAVLLLEGKRVLPAEGLKKGSITGVLNLSTISGEIDGEEGRAPSLSVTVEDVTKPNELASIKISGTYLVHNTDWELARQFTGTATHQISALSYNYKLLSEQRSASHVFNKNVDILEDDGNFRNMEVSSTGSFGWYATYAGCFVSNEVEPISWLNLYEGQGETCKLSPTGFNDPSVLINDINKGYAPTQTPKISYMIEYEYVE
jgi:hypothetical protein